MIIRKLRITSFRSFIGTQEIKFRQGAGFCLITGLNELEPVLGANGAGKSTIAEALTWALYGRTSRGLKGKELCSWGHDGGCLARVEFSIKESEYVLVRGWGPTVFTLSKDGNDPRTIKQEELDALTGINYEIWLASVFVSQFTTYFLDQGPSEKLQFFSQVLQLDRWMDCSDRAKEQTKKVEKQLSECQRVVRDAEVEIRSTKESLESIEKEEAAFEATKQTKLVALRETLHKLTETKESKVILCNEQAEKLSNFRKQFTGVETQFLEIDKQYSASGTELATLNGKLSGFPSQYMTLENKKAKLKTDTVCQSCGQKIPETKRTFAEASINKERSDLQQREAQLQVSKDEAYRIHQENTQRRKELQESYSQGLRERENLANRCKESDLELKLARERLVMVEQQIETLQASKPSSSRTKESLEARLKRAQQDLEKTQPEVPVIQKKLDRVSYWIKGFKDLRLWLITDALKQFELEINAVLPLLGLQGWSITFEVERETTSGTISRGFHVFIKSPTSPDPVSWEAWSGGETQRLRIAGVAALKNIIRSYTPFSCNIEVWDEPTAHLSQDGIDSLLRFFEQRAKQENTQVWLIDHRSLNYGFDQEITVVKNFRGSKLVPGRI